MLFHRRVAPLILPLCFLITVLLLNADLFRTPLTEASDLAANSIQVQHAEKLQETLGNYSRWHFHHPGPAFFYLLAGGEALFFDLLHLVPAPLNAQVLTIIIVNICFAGAAFEIFRLHCPTPGFVPLSFAVLVLFICVVNRTVTNGALTSLWMPHVPLFCFLLFMIACASVAANEIGHLPLAVACGGLLVHSHIVQTLFVFGIGGFVALTVYLRHRSEYGPVQFCRRYKKPILLSVLITCLFALPILVELFIDKPNNLDALLAYRSSYHGQLVSWGLSARYYLSFLVHVGNTEEVLQSPSASLLGLALSRSDVILYWIVFLVLTILAVHALLFRHVSLSFFTKALIAEIGLASLLFLFWGTRISGPLYNFNGFFIYSLQLLGFLILISIVFTGLRANLARSVAGVALAIGLFAMCTHKAYFQNMYHGSDDVRLIAERIPPVVQTVRIVFEPAQWPIAVGVANQMLRGHKGFCVAPAWAFMFGADSVCKSAVFPEIFIGTRPDPCAPRCLVIWKDEHAVAQFITAGRSN